MVKVSNNIILSPTPQTRLVECLLIFSDYVRKQAFNMWQCEFSKLYSVQINSLEESGQWQVPYHPNMGARPKLL